MVAGFLFKRNLNAGVNLINIDPDETSLDEIARLALKPKAGSDHVLILALQAVIAKEELERKSLNIKDADARIKKAVSETGVSEADLTKAARLLAHAISPMIVFGKGVTAQRDEKLIEALYQLAVQVGAVDGERSNILSLKGEANSQSASLMGLEQPFNPNGEKVTYIAVGDDYVAKKLVEKAAKSPYLVVQASYESKLTEQADVVLPVSIWAEQGGHYINLDGRIHKTEKAVTAPENVRDNLDVLTELAKRMNLTLDADWKKSIRERKSSVSLN
jgi:predicted molibdopterin-dependent oxidoreductase YjgC